MSGPSTAREALIVEAIGDAATLIQQVEALAPVVDETCQALRQADRQLNSALAGFETRLAVITENAKTRTVQHIAVRIDEAARRSMEQQSKAMADAARSAFDAELGPTLQRVQAALHPLTQRRQRHWEGWLTHLAAAVAASAATWVLALRWGGG